VGEEGQGPHRASAHAVVQRAGDEHRRPARDVDLRAMYRYIKSLGPAGKPAPAYLPPDKTPPQPYVAFPK
jgi:hypothetical protein